MVCNVSNFVPPLQLIYKEITDKKGDSVGGVNIYNLRYADEKVLCAKSEEQLQYLLDVAKVRY